MEQPNEITVKEKIIAEFIEKGADIEHERWSKWHIYMRDKPAEWMPRWNRQAETPYAELSEKEKESDRKEVRTYLPLLLSALDRVRDETLEEVGKEILPKIQKFIDKVESGKARSKETYADMLEIRSLIASLKHL